MLYATPSCVYCGMAKKLFEKHGIAFEERDVLKDAKARKEMEQKSGQLGVPVIEVENHIFVGFNRVALEEAIGVRKTEGAGKGR